MTAPTTTSSEPGGTADCAELRDELQRLEKLTTTQLIRLTQSTSQGDLAHRLKQFGDDLQASRQRLHATKVRPSLRTQKQQLMDGIDKLQQDVSAAQDDADNGKYVRVAEDLSDRQALHQIRVSAQKLRRNCTS